MAKTSKANELISIREFAKRLNVNHTAVLKAIHEEKITVGYNPKTKKINAKEIEKNEWVKLNREMPKKQGLSDEKFIKKIEALENKNKKIKVTEQNATEFQETSYNDEIDDVLENLKISHTMSLKTSTEINAIFLAVKNKIEILEKKKELVRKADVDRVLFAYASQLKKELMALPARIIDDIRAAPSKVDAINIFNQAMNDILKRFSEGNPLGDI